MKTNIIGVIIALMLTLFFSINALAKDDAKVSETRKVEAYTSIKVNSVATIYFTQSNTYALKIEGKEENVKNTTTTVKNGCLSIGFKDRKNDSQKRKDGVTIHLSAPDLRELDFEGVGSFNANAPLELNELKLKIEGVGNLKVKDLTCRSLDLSVEGVGKADIHVNCERLRAKVNGVGSVTLSGFAQKVDISKDGIGGVNTRNLKVGK